MRFDSFTPATFSTKFIS